MLVDGIVDLGALLRVDLQPLRLQAGSTTLKTHHVVCTHLVVLFANGVIISLPDPLTHVAILLVTVLHPDEVFGHLFPPLFLENRLILVPLALDGHRIFGAHPALIARQVLAFFESLPRLILGLATIPHNQLAVLLDYLVL